MMDRQIARASLRAYLVWLVLFIACEFVVFSMPGPWANLIEATDSGRGRPILPDLMFGFPDGQPESALNTIGDVKTSYIIFNAIDIPYAFLSMMAALSIMTLALKRFRIRSVILKGVLIVPIVYFAFEVIENGLLVLMAVDLLPQEGAAAIIQQLITTIKIATNGFNAAAGFAALVGYLAGVLIERLRDRTR